MMNIPLSAGAQMATGPRLSAIVMPLVKLLCEQDLSWADREQIASAIATAQRVHEGMRAEQRHLSGQIGRQGGPLSKALNEGAIAQGQNHV